MPSICRIPDFGSCSPVQFLPGSNSRGATQIKSAIDESFQARTGRTISLADLESVIGICLISIALYRLNKDSLFPGWRALLPVGGAFLLISAGQQAVAQPECPFKSRDRLYRSDQLSVLALALARTVFHSNERVRSLRRPTCRRRGTERSSCVAHLRCR
jgi:hypothetical protein